MEYTISTAWVIDVKPDEIEKATETELHKDIVSRTVTMAELMRAKYPDAEFRCVLADMIVSAPEIVLAQKR
jgi:hypothetical protein